MIGGIVPTFASICSGVGGFDLAFERAGYMPLFMCEIDRQCREVLRKHWACVTIHHDMLKLDLENLPRPDVLTISAPCQSFSQAGLRGSLEDARGNLILASVKIADILKPKYVVFENVPGILSITDNAFGCFLAGLAGCDAPLLPPRTIPRWKRGARGEYFSWPNAGVVIGRLRTVCWRIFDSQFFSVAQRRERCYVVASAGNNSAINVLFERKSGSWHNPKSLKSREDIAPTLESRARSGGIGTDFALNGGLQIHATNDKEWPKQIADTLTHAYADKQGLENQHIDGGAGLYVAAIRTAQTSSNGWGIDESGSSYTLDGAKGQAIAFRTSGNCGPFEQGDKTAALNCASDPNQNIIAFDTTQITSKQNGSNPQPGDACHPLASSAHVPSIASNFGCRRLTPLETERLQGFPDFWTKHAIDEKTGDVYEQADSPRYRQMGNAVSVPVPEWIARRMRPFIK